jgi:hypothetical protein
MLIMGATSLVATGRTLDGAGLLRAHALRLAANSLERATRHNSAYPVPSAPIVLTSNPDLNTESGGTCAANQTDSIYGTSIEQWTDADGGNTVGVPYQRISVKLTWACGGLADSVLLGKRIANVK